MDFTNDDAVLQDLELNVSPVELKASVLVRDLGLDDYFVRLAGRWHAPYEFRSGYWQSDRFYGDGEVPSRLVLDATAGYELPDQGLSFTATVANLLDDNTPDVLGAPIPARLAWLQVSYQLEGLQY